MDHLPLFLDVKERTILVDGGGTGAARRAERALSAGAEVRLFDPAPGAEVLSLLGRERFTHVPRVPQQQDFQDVIVAYGASDDPARDAVLHREGKAAGALVNVADVKPLCDFITPSVVERDAVTVAISTGGTAPVIGRILRARIEAMLPSNYGQLARFLSGFRKRIEAAIPGGRARRRFWEQMIDGPAADSFLEGDAKRAEALIKQRLASSHSDDRGDVTIIGLGSGEADLVTFRALRAMQRADLVLHDHNATPDMLALVRRDAERLNLAEGSRHAAQNAAKSGRRVVWLVSGAAVGDPEIETNLAELRLLGLHGCIIPGVGNPRGDNVVTLPIAGTAPDHAMGLAPQRMR